MSSIKAKFRILKQEPIKAVFKVNAVILADEIKEDLQNEISRAIQAENQLQDQINTITGDIDDISEELTTKADKSNTYTKNEVDIKIATVEVDAYTKQETNELLATKQPKGDYVTTTKLNTEVSKLATKTSLNLTNNNLDALTGEVENIAGELDSKADKSEIPTKTSDLQNDSNFTTEQEVAQMIASIPQFEVKVVQQLPQTGQAMVLYLVPKDGEAPDVYLEYIWLATTQSFELIGSTVVDLSDYYTKIETNVLLDTKQPIGDYATNTALTEGLATKADDNNVLHKSPGEEIIQSNNTDGRKIFQNGLGLKSSNGVIDATMTITDAGTMSIVNPFDGGSIAFSVPNGRVAPNNANSGKVDLGRIGFAWKNITLTGQISKASDGTYEPQNVYNYYLPDKSGTVALTSDVNTKQDKPTITKSSNNQSGIIQHPDGRMEQWGIATSSTTGETEFTMNNSFVDTNFQVFVEPRQAGDLVHYAIPSATNKFKARIQNTSGAYMTCQFQWRAYGFWK